MFKLTVVLAALVLSHLAHADANSVENWEVNKHVFTDKAMAVRYIVTNNITSPIVHSRCEILTNKFTFKACPKNKKSAFETEQFKSLSEKAPSDLDLKSAE